jgi:hypothetical protein
MKAIRLFFVITSLILVKTNEVNAQYNETIRADRPGAAIGPNTVGAHVFQLQAGYTYDRSEINQTTYTEEYLSAFDNVFRYGLTESFEINAGFGFAGGKARTDSSTEQSGGMNALGIGIRYNIYVGQGWVPSVGFQTSVGLPWLHNDFNSKFARPSLTLIASLNMTPKLAFTTNLGVVWNGNSANAIGYYVANFAFQATNKLSIFVEPYGYVNSGTWSPFYNVGAGYLINNDLQLDLFTGFGTGPHEYRQWLISTGVSWRVKFEKKHKQGDTPN